MVEPAGMKPVKLIGAGGATFAAGKDNAASTAYSDNSYKTEETRPMTEAD